MSVLGNIEKKLSNYRRLYGEICPCITITSEQFDLIKKDIGSRQMVNGGNITVPGKAIMSYKGTLIYLGEE